MPKANTPLHIGVIFGGRSGEHEVSLRSAQSVLRALDPQKYAITQIGITHEGTWLVGGDVNAAMLNGDTGHLMPGTMLPDPSHAGLYTLRPEEQGHAIELLTSLDVVFPVLHGTFGEDGTLQGVFEMAEVAYVGCGVTGSAVGMDKGVFKDVMIANGIPVVETGVFLRSQIEKDIQAVIVQAEQLAAYPLFVKPANLGSSVGITKCNARADLVEGLMEACRYDRRIVVQRGIHAREIEVSVLGNDNPAASLPGEVLPSREFYSYESKYVDGTSGLLIPAPIKSETSERIRSLAIQAFRAIDGAGLARVDFLLDKDSDALYLNEVNTMPGFTEISMYPKLWEASGLPYPALVDRLIALALERQADRAHTERKYS
ncbi:MAG: D-alanine--D-alanine ligase family protein [Chloroflexota bacterium]